MKQPRFVDIGKVEIEGTEGEPPTAYAVFIRSREGVITLEHWNRARPDAGSNMTLEETYELIAYLTEAAMRLEGGEPTAMARYR